MANSQGNARFKNNPDRQVARHNFLHYWQGHIAAYQEGLSSFLWAPISTLITTLAIGIALALPVGLLLLVEHAQNALAPWDKGMKISIYLQPKASEQQVMHVLTQVKANKNVQHVRLISAEQGLKEFQRQAQIPDVLSQLAENPIPAVIQVEPLMELAPAEMQQLADSFKQFSSVDQVSLDIEWVQKLLAFISLVQRALYALAALLSLAVLLIIGNTLKLLIQHRREDIEIMKLMGATEAQVRRPFLYYGYMLGLMGGVVACAFIYGIKFWLAPPAAQLLQLYQLPIGAHDGDFVRMVLFLMISAVLGGVASWLAANKQLRHIRPS